MASLAGSQDLIVIEGAAGAGIAKVLPNADVVDLAAYKAKGKTAGQAPNSDGAPGEIRTRAPASGGRCSIP